MKKFKPMKAPNKAVSFKRNKDDFYLGDLNYPVLASYKLDGLRCIFKDGEILSCSLKNIQNKQIRENFEPIRAYAEENNLILDGEIYNHKLPFSLISSCVMTQDHTNKKAIKSWEEKCEEYGVDMSREEAVKGMRFHIFDCVKDNNFEEAYGIRALKSNALVYDRRDIMNAVYQQKLYSAEEVKQYFKLALKDGYEGLILRDIKGRYKCGRGTLKEGLIYKVKPFRTFDAQIVGVIQATKVDPNAEKKINELGRSVTSKKKGDRIPIEKASAFVVMYQPICEECEGEEDAVKDCPVCKGVGAMGEFLECKPTLKMNDAKKEWVWKNRDSLIGKWIEYKGMLVGAKDVPRHPGFKRWRPDKDE